MPLLSVASFVSFMILQLLVTVIIERAAWLYAPEKAGKFFTKTRATVSLVIMFVVLCALNINLPMYSSIHEEYGVSLKGYGLLLKNLTADCVRQCVNVMKICEISASKADLANAISLY